MKITFKLALLLAVFSIVVIKTDAILDHSVLGIAADYALDSLIDFPIQILTPPSNMDGSIKYSLYTPSNKKEPCFIQPNTREFDKCLFNASYETKFLIHGFVVFLSPDNMFEDVKDAFFKYGNYNIIIVDWTLYNSFPFKRAYRYARKVGDKVKAMFKFIQGNKNVSLKDIHCIGHSLGAHVCGVAGRQLEGTLGRITGLDPGGISLNREYKPNIRLRYTDADFVDIIHTSDGNTDRGFGIFRPVGNQDFYANNGIKQPRCAVGNSYKIFKGTTLKYRTYLDKYLCNHFIAVEYFANSLKPECSFVATECGNYSDFENGKCQGGTKAEMGIRAQKIEGIKPKTVFYLETLEFPPYCTS